MTIDYIDILNFKNIPSASLKFTPGINCLLGNNGMGKSNMLEALYFLSMGRPMSSLPDSAIIRHGEETMMVKGRFLTDNGKEDTVACGIEKGKTKRLKVNDKLCRRLSEHIGNYPMVGILPSDTRLASGSAEERRKLMDMVISQSDPVYLTNLIRYTKSLESRNKMLRGGVKDTLLYESVESSMIETADYIHKRRLEWVEKIGPKTVSFYSELSGGAEQPTLVLKSRLNETPLNELLESRRAKDEILGYTTVGPHRDDIEATLDGYLIKEIGSQGQLKTFTTALKLSVFEFLREARGITPILLLDDIFDKLDASRVENIMKVVSGRESFGQIFITDTNRKHLDDIISSLEGDHSMFTVTNGEFMPSEK